MFKLISIEDTILIPPRLFPYPRLTALEHMINASYSDRVIPHIGLCIALWDWLRVDEDHLVIHTGESSTRCVFRMVVFAPFPGELVFGRINASHESGLFVEMGFFDAVHVEKRRLPRPSEWDEKERVWIWRPEVGEEGREGGEEEVEEGGAAQMLYMDVSNECIFRVVECVYEDCMKIRPAEREAGGGGKSVMSIRGSLYDEVLESNQGLGDPLWWFEGEEGEEEGGEDEKGEDEDEEREYGEGEAGGSGDEEEYVEQEIGEEFEERVDEDYQPQEEEG